MKNFFLATSPATRRTFSQKGFALVATILVMSMLMLLSVSMLTLSSVSTRASAVNDHQRNAEANARMAAMMALGKLQEYTGPDQRVTSNASVHSNVHVSKRNLMGVWNTENWDPTDPDNKELLTWLATVPITDPDAPSMSDVESEISDFGVEGSKVINIVGEGSLGIGATDENIVKIATIPIKDSSGQLSGSYGYWTSGLASRASYAVPVEASPSDWNRATGLGVAGKTGIGVLESTFEKNQQQMETNSAASHSASYQTLDLIFPDSDTPSAKHYHDLTNRSISLLTNTKDGGLKSDLSTAFELDLEEFNSIEEFHASKEKNNTDNYSYLNAGVYNQPEFYPASHKLGYLFEIPDGSNVMRGPTWDLLRNHYRVYKKDWENNGWPRGFSTSDTAVATRGSLPLSYSTTAGQHMDGGRFALRAGAGGIYDHIRNSAYKQQAEPAYTGEFSVSQGTTKATAARVSPLLLRVTMVLGLRKKATGQPAPNDWKIALSFDPYVTIMNPYNRPIEFESVGVYAFKFNPLRFNVEWTDENGDSKTLKDLMFSVNTGTNGSLAYRILPPNEGIHRLEPGEIKVLSPKPNGGTEQEFGIGSKNFVEADFSYGEDTGLYLYMGGYRHGYRNPPIIKPRVGSTIKLELYGRCKNTFGKNEKDFFTFTQFLKKDHSGSNVNLDQHIPPYMQASVDVFDDSHIASLSYATYDNINKKDYKNHSLYTLLQVNESSIPDVGDTGQYIGALDMRMKHGAEDTPVFHQFNPRAQVFDSRSYDGGARISPSWTMDFKKITDVSDLQLVADPSGRAYWGGGIDAASGSKKVVLFELPRSPATSLGALTHADTAVLPANGANVIANSFTNPGLQNTTDIIGKRASLSKYTNQSPQTIADFSWAANEAISDQYFFSGINWGNANLSHETGSQKYSSQTAAIAALKEFKTGEDSVLANSRINYSPVPSNTLDSDLTDYSKIAKHLSIVGGFNVNSTSVKAWRAVLSALKNADVRYLHENGQIVSKKADVPFSRFMMPSGDDTDKWAGFRNITDNEITALAEAIVEQVKVRGPFMGMSDFINRRLTTENKDGSEIGKLGALQMAIEKAGLNDTMYHNVTSADVENKTISAGGKSITLSTMVGTPGYLMQSDVLTTIGSILRARSDTFVIRAYGESLDTQGNVKAQAWCELTIQRTPEWLSPTDEPFKILDSSYPNLSTKTIVKPWVTNPSFPEINKKYGRRMKIVSFKWLNADEI